MFAGGDADLQFTATHPRPLAININNTHPVRKQKSKPAVITTINQTPTNGLFPHHPSPQRHWPAQKNFWSPTRSRPQEAHDDSLLPRIAIRRRSDFQSQGTGGCARSCSATDGLGHEGAEEARSRILHRDEGEGREDGAMKERRSNGRVDTFDDEDESIGA